LFFPFPQSWFESAKGQLTQKREASWLIKYNSCWRPTRVSYIIDVANANFQLPGSG